MSLARAIAFFVGFLALDALAAFVALVAGGLVAPKGLGTGLTVVLSGVFLAIFVAFAASAAIYLRMLFAAEPAMAGRWILAILFLFASVALYLGAALVTLVMFNR